MIDEFSRSAAARALWPIFDFLETLGQLSRKLILFLRSTTINTRQPPQAKGGHAINKLFSAFRRVRRLTLLFIDHGNAFLLEAAQPCIKRVKKETPASVKPKTSIVRKAVPTLMTQ